MEKIVKKANEAQRDASVCRQTRTSLHVTAYLNRQPVGMIRLILNPTLIKNEWRTVGELPPFDSSVALTRFVIDPQARGTELMRLLAFISLRKAKSLDRKWGIAAIRDGSPLLMFLRKIGWKFTDVTARIGDGGEEMSAQVAIYDLDNTGEIEERITSQIDALARRRYSIEIDSQVSTSFEVKVP